LTKEAVMSLKDFQQGQIDAEKQLQHEKEGHDRGLLDTITGNKCHHEPSKAEDKDHYEQGFWERYKKG
jgi:hypothetical protein